jgi:hypothetical protein
MKNISTLNGTGTYAYTGTNNISSQPMNKYATSYYQPSTVTSPTTNTFTALNENKITINTTPYEPYQTYQSTINNHQQTKTDYTSIHKNTDINTYDKYTIPTYEAKSEMNDKKNYLSKLDIK